MRSNSTAELVQDWPAGMIILVACVAVGIGGASLLRGLPAGMEIDFVLGALVTFVGISLLIGRE